MATDITIGSITNGTTVTNGTSNGTGVVDVVMNAIALHIMDDYDKGRLKGTDYATVRLGSIQSVLQQAFQYALAERTTEAQVDMILQQTLTEVQNTARAVLEVSALVPAQIEKMQADVLIAQTDAMLREKEIQLKEFEITNMLPMQLALIQAQVAAMEADSILKVKELEIKDKDLEIKVKELLMKEIELQIAAKELLIKESQLSIMNREIDLKENESLLSAELTAKQVLMEDQKITSLILEDAIKEVQNTQDLLVKDAQITDINFNQSLKVLDTQLGTVANLYSSKSIDELPDILKTSNISVQSLYNDVVSYTE